MKIFFIIPLLVVLITLGLQESFSEHQIESNNKNCFEIRTLEDSYSIEDIKNGIVCYRYDKISIRVEITTTGNSTIDIPRMILDSRDENCNDTPFTVQLRETRLNVKFDDNRHYNNLLDHNEVTTDKNRILSFHVPPSEIMKESYYGHVEELDRIEVQIVANRYADQSCRKQIQAVYSPLEQYRYGIFETDIVCNNDLQLVFKKNWMPACVKESSIDILIKSGWARSEKFPIIFTTDKEVYKIGEPITITMKNIGIHNLQTPSVPVGFSLYYQDGMGVCSTIGPFEAIGNFPVGSELTKTLDENYCLPNLSNMKPGTYEIRANHFYAFREGIMPTHTFEIFVEPEYYDLRENMDSKYVGLFDRSVMIFTGTLTSKNASNIPDAYHLNFDVTNDLKLVNSQNVTVTSHEDVWKNCIVEEGSEYLIFITSETGSSYKPSFNTCTLAIELPSEIADDIKLLSSLLYE